MIYRNKSDEYRFLPIKLRVEENFQLLNIG